MQNPIIAGTPPVLFAIPLGELKFKIKNEDKA
jgi:hypothetical protein